MNQPYDPYAQPGGHPGAGGASFGDLDQIDERGFVPVPAGQYPIRATKIEMAQTRKGGQIIKVEFEITDGQHRGYKIFDNFNVQNTNHQTVQIALRHIKQWLIAAGHDPRGQLTLERVKQLEGVPVWAMVKIEVDPTGEYDSKNRVARFVIPDSQAGSAAPAAPSVTPGAASQPAAAPTNQPTAPQPTTPAPGPAPANPPAYANPAPAPAGNAPYVAPPGEPPTAAPAPATSPTPAAQPTAAPAAPAPGTPPWQQ